MLLIIQILFKFQYQRYIQFGQLFQLVMYHNPNDLPAEDLQSADQDSQNHQSLKIGSILFICLQYVQQGILSFIPQTLILTYSRVPSYNVLSVFQAIKIPWALKFIYAPFLEVYTYVFYGKRKFWMILSGCIMGLFFFIASFFTSQNNQVIVAIIFMMAMIFSSTSDISTDACSLKDLKNPQNISFVQATARRVGTVIGGFIFLKLVLPKFGRLVGLKGAIVSIPFFFNTLGIFFILSELIGHFTYKQQVLQQEIDRKDDNLCHTIKEYKVFFQSKKKYFRTGLFLFLSVQGLLFFSSSYQYELMRKGFSKQRINEIITFSSIPVLIIIYFFSRYANQSNMYKLMGIVIIGKMTIYILAYILQPRTTMTVIIYIFCDETFNSLYDMIGGIIINYFPVTAISGMMITMLNSFKNLGNFASLHLIIVGLIGHRTASLIGFVIHALFMIFGFRKMVKWVKQGELDGDEEGLKNQKHKAQTKDQKITQNKSQRDLEQQQHNPNKNLNRKNSPITHNVNHQRISNIEQINLNPYVCSPNGLKFSSFR